MGEALLMRRGGTDAGEASGFIIATDTNESLDTIRVSGIGFQPKQIHIFTESNVYGTAYSKRVSAITWRNSRVSVNYYDINDNKEKRASVSGSSNSYFSITLTNDGFEILLADGYAFWGEHMYLAYKEESPCILGK